MVRKSILPGLVFAAALVGATCDRSHPLGHSGADGAADVASAPDSSSRDGSGSDGLASEVAVTDANPTDATDGGCAVGYPELGCRCPADLPTVCAASCVDLQSDPDHCGTCATKCPAMSVCGGGACSPVPTVVVPAQPPVVAPDGAAASCGPLHLATDGTTLYWTDTLKGSVNSLAAGGAPVVIAPGQVTPTLLRVAGGALFWLGGDGATLVRASLPMGTPSVIVTSLPTDTPIQGFAVTSDGLTVYFSNAKLDDFATPHATLSRVTATGGLVTVVGTDEVGHGLPGPVAVDGTTLVFSDGPSGFVDAVTLVDETLARCEVPPPASALDGIYSYVDCVRLSQGRPYLFPDDIFVTGGKAYFVDGSTLLGSGTAQYDTNSIALSFGGNPITAVTLDGQNAYFAEGGRANIGFAPAAPGFVEETPLGEESTAVPLARVVDPRNAATPAAITSIAVVGANVLYATGDCAIWTIAK
jgi:hypothetical protein